jgi:chromatin modification-related protein EAF6
MYLLFLSQRERREGERGGNRKIGKRLIEKQDSPMDTATSTPVAAMAPTPLSTSFVRGDGGSNHATPTSASSANRSGAGSKKNKKGGNGDDSETDTKESKKARTNFGVTRK